jgi:predicted permease
VLGLALLTVLTVSALIGLLPALRVSATSVAAALSNAARGSSGSHDGVRRAIVAAEVAVSLILICGSCLLLKSLLRLQQVDVGVRMENVITAALDLPRDRYPTGARAAAFYGQLTGRMGSIPGVVSASVSGEVPLEGTGGENLMVPGREDRLLVRFKRADEAYFPTMGIPIIAGRGFTAADREGAPFVTIINEALAARLHDRFGMTNPVGQTVNLPALGLGSSRRELMTVVGVIRSERIQSDLRVPLDAVAYVPIAQAPRLWIKLAVRTQGEPAAAVPAIRAAVHELDPRLALAGVRTMEQIRERSLSELREPVWLVAMFAALSAVLAALGLYGVVAHSVTQQRREIGIRMALGARSSDVRAMVVRRALTMIAAGLGVGVAGAAAMTRVTRSLLFEVSALDPAAFVAAAAGMFLIGVIAALVPAGRATRVDPTVALRSEN